MSGKHHHHHTHDQHEGQTHDHPGGGAGGLHKVYSAPGESILTVRAVSGLSGDIMLTGLALMCGLDQPALANLADSLKLTFPGSAVTLEKRMVNGISGWGCAVNLPHEHAHRSLRDILEIIEASGLTDAAKVLSTSTFTLLAKAEAEVHGKRPDEVTFHEVGALDSILDICMVCALFDRLSPAHFICSPLPLADGSVYCAHGHIPVPAPAVMKLLKDVPVTSFPARGETVTPTAIALLKSLKAVFAPWPAMIIENQALVYGTKVFENAPNGTIWAYGSGHGQNI